MNIGFFISKILLDFHILKGTSNHVKMFILKAKLGYFPKKNWLIISYTTYVKADMETCRKLHIRPEITLGLKILKTGIQL